MGKGFESLMEHKKNMWDDEKRRKYQCSDCHKEKSLKEESLYNIERTINCNCGKLFKTTKQYAGHKTWCKIN